MVSPIYTGLLQASRLPPGAIYCLARDFPSQWQSLSKLRFAVIFEPPARSLTQAETRGAAMMEASDRSCAALTI